MPAGESVGTAVVAVVKRRSRSDAYRSDDKPSLSTLIPPRVVRPVASRRG